MRLLPLSIFSIAISFCAPLFAAPLASEVVSERSLTAPSVENIGALDEKNGGLGLSMWKGTDRATARTLLLNLPATLHSSAATELKKRLLLSTAQSPDGDIKNGDKNDKNDSKNSDTSLLSLRLKQLALMGDISALDQLMHAIPTQRMKDEFAQIHVAGFFIADKAAKGCTQFRTYLPAYQRGNAPFWRKTLVVCHALDGKNSEADFAFKLMKDDQVNVSSDFDALFANLISESAENKKKGSEQWLAMLRTETLSLTPEMRALNFPSDAIISKISGFNRSAWNASTGTTDAEKLHALARLYGLASAAGATVSTNEWLALVSSSHSARNTPPYSVLHLLNEAQKNKRVGETIALSLIALGESKPSELPDDVIAMIVFALSQVGQNSAAAKLAAEGA